MKKTMNTMASAILMLGAGLLTSQEARADNANGCNVTDSVLNTQINTHAYGLGFCCNGTITGFLSCDGSYSSAIYYDAYFSGNGEDTTGYTTIDSYNSSPGNFGFYDGLWIHCATGWVNSQWQGPFYSAGGSSTVSVVCGNNSAWEAEAYVLLNY